MRLRLMGTGGADGVPGFYSDSRVSRYARQHGGKDIRTRAAAVVDDVLKIDLGPDTWWQSVRDSIDARDWTAILFTHSDADHFAPDELMYCLFPFNQMEYAGFTIYANGFICRRILEKVSRMAVRARDDQKLLPVCPRRLSDNAVTGASQPE